ncbi:MAG: peptidoglycan editing factor PgeF [Nitrospiraceae bacterium]
MTDALLITIPEFSAATQGACHFFGTRQAGHLRPGEHGNRDVSATEQSLRSDSFPLRAQLNDCAVVAVKQVHGTDALVVSDAMPSTDLVERGWDALVTDRVGVCLTIKTADCVPVLLHDTRRGVIAAIHAGWRGAVAGILPKTLETMRSRFGSAEADVQVAIGPSAGVCCYEVDAPVLARVREDYPNWRQVVERHDAARDRAHLHLHALLTHQAETAGVAAERVHRAKDCTICQPERFFSYRREGQARGTMISGIVRPVTRRAA